MMAERDCPCCQSSSRWFAHKTEGLSLEDIEELTKDTKFIEEWEKVRWHCEDCWERFHDRLADHDYISFEEKFGEKR